MSIRALVSDFTASFLSHSLASGAFHSLAFRSVASPANAVLFATILVGGSAEAGGLFAQPDTEARLRAQAARTGVARVIVELRLSGRDFVPEGRLAGRSAVAAQHAAIATARSRLAASLASRRAREYRSWDSFPLVALEVGADALGALATSPLVKSISEDALNEPLLADAIPHIGADQTLTHGYGGAGQVVVILDTGIDEDHPFFAGRLVHEACYSAAGNGGVSLCPDGSHSQIGVGAADALTARCMRDGLSICYHGTHVAGIAAGKDPGPPTPAPDGIRGVAPEANIVAIQVFTRFDGTEYCGRRPSCVLSWTSDVISALDHVNDVVRTSWDVAAVNLSLGSGLYTSACDDDPVKPAIDTLLSNRIATTIASGNAGYVFAVASPACISTAITVSSSDNPTDEVSSFSNMDTVVDLLAPGRGISSAVPDDSYSRLSGTSMAAPVAAGAFAVLKAAKPSATVAELLAALTTTGVPITDDRGGPSPHVTRPRIQLDRAVALVDPGVCDNGQRELSEECEIGDAGLCPTGVCDPDCTCEDPVCGNSVLEDGESCDQSQAAACPTGICDPDCTCADPVCGNGVREDGEQCDATSAAACPTAACDPDCTCPDPACGNDVVEEGETCDGSSDVLCADSCLPPGHADECACRLPDECADARTIGAFPYSDNSIDTAAATVGIDDPADCSGEHSVWYAFTAPGSGVVTATSVGSGFGSQIAAWRGACGSLLPADEATDCDAGTEATIAFHVTAGDSYRLEVSSYEGGGPLAVTATFEQAPCGNGVIDTGEQCDGEDEGTCATSQCNFDCTCGCTDAPAPDCKAPAAAGTSRLKINDSSDDRRDQLRWLWKPGTATTRDELGDPTIDGVYQLCVYDGATLVSDLKARGDVFCGGPFCWTADRTGYRYSDKTEAGNGVSLIRLRSGADGESSIAFRAAGEDLVAPPLGTQLTGPVIVQLQRYGAACWESVFSPPFRQNEDTRFADNAD